jgi:hypothetical protein
MTHSSDCDLVKVGVALTRKTGCHLTHGQVRVIDESGEDYLYPKEFFVSVELPQALRRRVLQAA